MEVAGTLPIPGLPGGLLLTSILQSPDGAPVRLYERRREYTRTRMVSIAPYLVSDSIEAYHADSVDGESIDAIFDESELKATLAFRQSMSPDLFNLLKQWSLGFCPLNAIEQTLSSLIDSRDNSNVERAEAVVGAEDAMALVDPGDLLIDCSGARSVMRDHLVASSNGEAKGQNTQRFRLEYALVVTFLYG